MANTTSRQVKELLYKFQKLNPDVEDFEPTLKALWRELDQHIKEEENGDLPTLEKHLDADESARLADSFDTTKAFVPSRSHPSAPDSGGPFETVMGLMAAPLDRLGDMFRKFPRRDPAGVLEGDNEVRDIHGERADAKDPLVGGRAAAKDVRGDRVAGDGVSFNDPVGKTGSKKGVLDDHPSPRDVPGNRVP